MATSMNEGITGFPLHYLGSDSWGQIQKGSFMDTSIGVCFQRTEHSNDEWSK